jgi:transcriptional regulator with XRE-family HTH domain
MSMSETPLSADAFGDVLRDWRRRRRLSQLDLGLEAEVSARHLSFLETGRAKPSRVMVDRLADGLDMPLDARNALLVAAGFAPRYRAGRWEDEALAPARQAFERVMAGHAPYPAILFDRHWTALDANAAGWLLLGGPGEGINLIERLIEDETLRAQVLNWAEVGPFMRAESRHAGGDAVLDDYADRLTALIGPETVL